MMLPATHPAQLVLGLVVWSVWFVALYGGLSVGCATAPPAPEQGALNWLNGILLLLTLGTTALLLHWAWRCWRAGTEGQSRFTSRTAAGVHVLSAGATLAVGLPAAVLPPCL